MPLAHRTEGNGKSRGWRRAMGFGGVAGFGGVLAILVAVSILATGVSPVPLTRILPSKGSTASGTGAFQPCGGAVTNATTGWVCNRAIALHGVGYARGWTQLQASVVLSNLSGTQPFWGDGALQLARGFAQVRVACLPGASAYARVYVFWHVWIYDRNSGTFVDQLNSGYVWDSGDTYCPASGGSVTVSSPKISGTFNSSHYGSYTYDFAASHAYILTFFLGCTSEAQVSAAGPGAQATAGAFCNIPGSASSSTMSLYGVSVG